MLIDGQNRVINYARISVTQRCNFRCRYCMPFTPFSFVPHEQILSYEDMFELVKILIDGGVTKIRVTGGEPLVRKGVENFIKMISNYAPKIDLAMTTNGFLLEKFAPILKQNGLKRLNISLDTLDAKKFEFISKQNAHDSVLKGIDAAIKQDFEIKLNTVCMSGVNDDEIGSLLKFARQKNLQIRFIEYMENRHGDGELKGMNSKQILTILAKEFSFTPLPKEPNSPSSLYKLDDGYKFGVIDPHRHDFCDTCNKIRISAEGVILPCLYFDEGKSIKEAIKIGDIDSVKSILNDVLRGKPEKNRWETGTTNESSNRAFYHTGG